MTPPTPEVFPVDLDHIPDIRLIACDMDGTLLDDDDAIHDEFWPLIETLYARGIIFCPASGRQYSRLLNRFEPIADDLIFIAENGTYVVQKGVELSSDPLALDDARTMIRVAREPAKNRPAVVVSVDDLLTVEDDILKVAVFAYHASERVTYPAYERFTATHQVVVSGQHWLDVMVNNANKGSGIRHIQDKLGITRDQTMVFGDFLNDMEMMDEATYSFAMANAHPALKERARYLSPGNTDNGVVRTIKAVLGLK